MKGYINRPPGDVIRNHRLFSYQLEYPVPGLYFSVTTNPHKYTMILIALYIVQDLETFKKSLCIVSDM